MFILYWFIQGKKRLIFCSFYTYILLAWSFTTSLNRKVMIWWDFFRLSMSAPTCSGTAAGTVCLKKPHHIIILLFSELVKGHANCFLGLGRAIFDDLGWVSNFFLWPGPNFEPAQPVPRLIHFFFTSCRLQSVFKVTLCTIKQIMELGK